jgi:hypothetical protein
MVNFISSTETMILADWAALSQLIYNLAGSVAAIGTLGAAIYAVRV